MSNLQPNPPLYRWLHLLVLLLGGVLSAFVHAYLESRKPPPAPIVVPVPVPQPPGPQPPSPVPPQPKPRPAPDWLPWRWR